MTQDIGSEAGKNEFFIQRLKLASAWLLLLGALFAVFVWMGYIANAKAVESDAISTSRIWSEIANGRSAADAMHDMGFSTKEDEAPDWLLEICSLDVLGQAYIDEESGIVGITLSETLSDACEIMRREFSAKGWVEVVADEADDANKTNRPAGSTPESLLTDNRDEGYLLSFSKDKGITRWITMECAESAKGTSIVLHIERI